MVGGEAVQQTGRVGDEVARHRTVRPTLVILDLVLFSVADLRPPWGCSSCSGGCAGFGLSSCHVIACHTTTSCGIHAVFHHCLLPTLSHIHDIIITSSHHSSRIRSRRRSHHFAGPGAAGSHTHSARVTQCSIRQARGACIVLGLVRNNLIYVTLTGCQSDRFHSQSCKESCNRRCQCVKHNTFH